KDAADWKLLGAHPGAAAQPTATGKALVTLCPWQHRLYVGYGDYQENSGPIDVTAWDPARGAFTRLHTSDTEAIYNYRPIGSSLYALATDRRANADYAIGEPWRDEMPVTSAHTYDIATLGGNDLWLVGAAEGGNYLATAWRSDDGGAHWRIAHQPGWNGRYYFAAVYHDKLYLESWAEEPLGPSEVFDGTSWTRGPELLPEGGHGVRPVVFHDRLVYATKQTFASPYPTLAATPNKLLGFDGEVAAPIFDRELLDFFADEAQLLALDTDGVIWRTTDLAHWTRVVAASELHPRSLAVLDGVLYVGTSDAKLYSLVR
ncbi:MAG: hypothetical protein HOV81_28235, partial [Kofleriaceae bacterium]|nr:hypothetical protein [Kofleriaceae bacterium]